MLLGACSVALLQAAAPVARGPIGPVLPTIQRTISTQETLTIEMYQWETSENGGPVHFEQYKELVGQRWRRSFGLELKDVDQDLRAPGRRTRRAFESAVDEVIRVYGEPSTGPNPVLWTFRGWPEGLALDLVSDTAPKYLDEEDQSTSGLRQSSLDSLRVDCALAALSRRIAVAGAAATLISVEPELLRDLLFPGGDLFDIQFALTPENAASDPSIWYEPWPCWIYAGRSAQFGSCSGTIELRPKAPASTTFTMVIRVKCRTDSSPMAQRLKQAWRNELKLLRYDGHIDTEYALEGELVFDRASSLVCGVHLSGTVKFLDFMEVLRLNDGLPGSSKYRGTFKATGTLEHRWAAKPAN